MNARPALLLAALMFNLHAEPALSELLADTAIPKDVAAKIKSYSCNEFESHEHELAGQIIKLKFTYRNTRIEDLRDGTCTGELQFYIETSRRRTTDSGWGMVDVIFPKAAMPWFSKIATNIDARGTITVIGRVEEGERGRCRVMLIGREIKTDAKGTRAVW